ncbi:type VI secretion system protein [Francisella orientalis]|uniref:type VI secretion system protein n=1 Tax=Francisella orientalis TaxID=299583 RepID=UPI001E2D6706|nr:type VI secretion system protein [Francisella orientalis]
MNAERLITETPNELERDFNKYKNILKKIYNSGIRNIPIYVFLTNMDKLPGFVEYFDPKSFDVTNNILGVTLPSSNVSEPLDWLDDQFNNIINNINEKVFSSIRKKNSNIDNNRAFYFVRYFSYLCEKLNSVLADAIYENNYTKSLYFRGVYFTAISTNKIHHFDKARSDVYF